MKHWAAVIGMVLMLSGCAQKAAFEELSDGVCTRAQGQLVEAHISAQIDAIAKENWESAYTFASESFRSLVELDQFIFVIGSQYKMLIENQGYEFGECSIVNSEVTQQVAVKGENELTDLTYTLSVKKLTLGVESVLIGSVDSQQLQDL
jgi:outer membrane murein-binding lipoprotein Lpp